MMLLYAVLAAALVVAAAIIACWFGHRSPRSKASPASPQIGEATQRILGDFRRGPEDAVPGRAGRPEESITGTEVPGETEPAPPCSPFTQGILKNLESFIARRGVKLYPCSSETMDLLEWKTDPDSWWWRRPRVTSALIVFLGDEGGKKRTVLKIYEDHSPHRETHYRWLHGLVRSDRWLAQSLCAGDELLVDRFGDRNCDVLVMPWIEGDLLHEFVAKMWTADPAATALAAQRFREVTRTMHEKQWSHGDYSPANIVVTRAGSELRLMLLDADSFAAKDYVQPLRTIYGHEHFQPPLRIAKPDAFCTHPWTVDYPSELIIYLSLLIYSGARSDVKTPGSERFAVSALDTSGSSVRLLKDRLAGEAKAQECVERIWQGLRRMLDPSASPSAYQPLQNLASESELQYIEQCVVQATDRRSI